MQRSQRDALVDGLSEIDRLVEELGLDSTTKQRATRIYREAVTTDETLIGHGVNKIIAGCIVLASREAGSIVEAKDVAECTEDHITEKGIHTCTKHLRNELDIGFMLADPHAYVDQIAEELDAPDEMIEMTHDAVDCVVEHGIASGNKAGAIAGSCFYLLCVMNKSGGAHGSFTQADVSVAANVSEVTIRNNYREFAEVIQETEPEILECN